MVAMQRLWGTGPDDDAKTATANGGRTARQCRKLKTVLPSFDEIFEAHNETDGQEVRPVTL